MIDTRTGAVTMLDTMPAVVPDGMIVVSGAEADIQRVARSLQQEAARKARRKAAKLSRRANR